MPKKITIYDIEPDRSEELVKKADIIFCLDYNSLDRIDKLGEVVAELENTTLVMIDHHLYPDIQAEFQISDPSASSTCEADL